MNAKAPERWSDSSDNHALREDVARDKPNDQASDIRINSAANREIHHPRSRRFAGRNTLFDSPVQNINCAAGPNRDVRKASEKRIAACPIGKIRWQHVAVREV